MDLRLAGLVALAGASVAPAETITFDGLAFDGGAGTAVQSYASVVVGDYRFTAQAGTPLVVRSRGDPDNADHGGAAIGLRTSGAAYGVSFARVDGAAFDFTGFQATHFSDSLVSPGNGGTLTVYLDGVVGLQSSYDINPGFQSYALAGSGVQRARITSDNYFQIDNLLVAGARATALPEPAGWATMIAGLGAVGAALRRRAGRARA